MVTGKNLELIHPGFKVQFHSNHWEGKVRKKYPLKKCKNADNGTINRCKKRQTQTCNYPRLLWNILTFNVSLSAFCLSLRELNLPAGLMVFPPIAISTAVLTRIPIVSFSGFSRSSLAAKGKQIEKQARWGVRNKEPQHHETLCEIYNPALRASFTCTIRRSEDVALVVKTAAVIAGIKWLRVFFPGFCSPEI